MAQSAATIDPYAVNPSAENSPATNSFAITPGTGFGTIPRQIHNGGTSGTVVGWLMGDNLASAARTFYLAQGGALSYRFIQIDVSSTAGGLVGVW